MVGDCLVMALTNNETRRRGCSKIIFINFDMQLLYATMDLSTRVNAKKDQNIVQHNRSRSCGIISQVSRGNLRCEITAKPTPSEPTEHASPRDDADMLTIPGMSYAQTQKKVGDRKE